MRNPEKINFQREIRIIQYLVVALAFVMAMVIAGLCAEGESIIKSSEVIYRGYANLVEKLQGLGLKVTERP